MPTRLKSLALAHAYHLLADVISHDGISCGGCAEVAGGGWSVRVTVEPIPEAKNREFTACELDILAILSEQIATGARLSTQAVLDQLEARNMVHGTTTVKIALARLAREKVIGSSRRSPRGYWLHRRGEEVGT